MSDLPQIYLKEEEIEHVISALSGSTSARDLAEAIGRSEAEVIEVVQKLRLGSEPPSEIDLLREQNALLTKQIEELKSRRQLSPRQRIRLAAACGAVLLLVLGVWTMFVATSVQPAPPAVPVAAPLPESVIGTGTTAAVEDSGTLAPPSAPIGTPAPDVNPPASR